MLLPTNPAPPAQLPTKKRAALAVSWQQADYRLVVPGLFDNFTLTRRKTPGLVAALLMGWMFPVGGIATCHYDKC
ncbi:hypothetical protein [Phaeovulum sp.]|uniref:hypothetical protein n=1 Tax=Phaeovulum sp. TaxID=2934796 RepID=UPI0039E57841